MSPCPVVNDRIEHPRTRMTIIVTVKDLTKPLVDIEADRKKLKNYLKPAIIEAAKAATNVWFLDQGRLVCLKGSGVSPCVLGINQIGLLHSLVEA